MRATWLWSILWIVLHNGNHPSCPDYQASPRRGRSSEAAKSQSVSADPQGSDGPPGSPPHPGSRGAGPARLPDATAHRGRSGRVGGGGGMAGRLNRGDVFLCRLASPDKQRPVVILTRDSAI